MISILLTAFYLIVPLMLAGILHMIVVKKNLLPFLSVPIDVWTFGRNKTWRGLAVMTVGGIVGVWVALLLFGKNELLAVNFDEVRPTLLGACLGFAYALFELPNSFLKRRMGVAPGKTPPRHKWLFFILDHIDSMTGCVIVYVLVFDIQPIILVTLVIMAPILHILVNFILWAIGIRKEKF